MTRSDRVEGLRVIPVNLDAIPAELRAVRNWVNWKLKPAKEPGLDLRAQENGALRGKYKSISNQVANFAFVRARPTSASLSAVSRLSA